MATTNTQTHTTTGAKTGIDIPNTHRVTFSLLGDETDYVADIQVQLVPAGNWITAEASLADNTPKTTVGPISAIRVNITSMGAASTIDFEVVSQRN